MHLCQQQELFFLLLLPMLSMPEFLNHQRYG
jgi:hypothetical protein